MIERSKDRIKQTGEIFTPTELVEEILDKLPPELFTDHTITFLDPACGDGQFLVSVLLYKMDNNSTATEALHTIYGVELMDDNVRACKDRLLEIAGDTKLHRKIVDHNIVCANSLEFDYDAWQPYELPELELEPATSDQRYETLKQETVTCSGESNMPSAVTQSELLRDLLGDRTEW